MNQKRVIKAALFTPNPEGRWGLPLLFEGRPGVAKTAIVRRVAREHGLHVETLIAAIRQPDDFLGIPVPNLERKLAERLLDKWAVLLTEKARGVAFFDEIKRCPPAVQAALLRVIHEGAVGEHVLPPGVRFMAATNPGEYGGWDLDPAMANRFGHLAWDAPSADDWGEPSNASRRKAIGARSAICGSHGDADVATIAVGTSKPTPGCVGAALTRRFPRSSMLARSLMSRKLNPRRRRNGHSGASVAREREDRYVRRLPQPYYKTGHGAAYLGDSRALMECLPDGSIDLVMTSPPFALKRKKDYGNVEDKEYLDWFRPFAAQFVRILKPAGSLVIDIGGTWVRGQPTRSLYHFELLIMLCREFGLHLAQDFYWYNPARLPSPAEWVTVRRLRVKDAVDPIWWLSKIANPKADNRRVLVEYSAAMRALLANGYKAQLRPSGHDISTKFKKDNNGAIPPNLISISNTESNSRYLALCRQAGIKPHPARYPRLLPEFFIKFLTDSEDAVVLDPFGGSNVTGEAAEALGRRWLSFELEETYLRASRFRFEGGVRPASNGLLGRAVKHEQPTGRRGRQERPSGQLSLID